MPIAKIIVDKREQILHLSHQYGVLNIRVFGSMTRDATDDSDKEILIRFGG